MEIINSRRLWLDAEVEVHNCKNDDQRLFDIVAFECLNGKDGLCGIGPCKKLQIRTCEGMWFFMSQNHSCNLFTMTFGLVVT